VATALSPPDIEFHSIELPNANTAELSKVVEFEVKRLFTRDDTRVETRHWTLPHTGSAEGGPNAVGVVIPYDKVVETVELCRGERLTCSRVDTGATTLSRFSDLLNAWPSEEIWGVLDLGHRQSRLILCLESVPILVRTVGAGGDVWTQRIAEALGTTAKTAEVHKRDHGIAVTSRDTTVSAVATVGGHQSGEHSPQCDGTRAELASVLLGILRSDLNQLASEVKRSYEYALSCYPRRRAADLILVGGGAAMRNLPEYLTDALGIPVRRASAYLESSSCRLRYSSGKQNALEAMALAIGLAIGG
jgi:Tfp pilus assembly PilM family ATPase